MREALIKLVEALGCWDRALRRDECGDWAVFGKHGHIYAVSGTLDRPKTEGFQIYFRGAGEFEARPQCQERKNGHNRPDAVECECREACFHRITVYPAALTRS